MRCHLIYIFVNTPFFGMPFASPLLIGHFSREARKSDPRDVEFLFVLTDGEEMNTEGPTIRQLCEAAAKRGVIVVGIGMGEGMKRVEENFPFHLVEQNPERLPELLADFLKEYVQSMQEME